MTTHPNHEAIATVREALIRYTEICGNAIDRQMSSEALAALDTLSAAQVPDGWQLVPKEPTKEMTDAGAKEQDKYHALMFHWNALNVFRAMIAAAPQVPENNSTVYREPGAKTGAVSDPINSTEREATPRVEPFAPQASGEIKIGMFALSRCNMPMGDKPPFRMEEHIYIRRDDGEGMSVNEITLAALINDFYRENF